MGKQDKKRIKHRDGTGSKIARQNQSDSPRRRVKFKRYAILSISVLVVAIAVVSTWAIFMNSSQDSSKSALINKSPTKVPPANLGSNSTNISGGPQISFPEKSYNFGKVAQGSKPSHTFVVRNTGDAPLKLIRAAGS